MKIMFGRFGKSFWRGERGNVLVIVTVFLVGLIGFAALSIDVGNMYVQRNKIQEGVDLTAVASVTDWALRKGQAVTIATGNAYGQTNGLQLSEFTVTPGLWNNSARSFTPASILPLVYPANTVPAVRVDADRVVATPFARIVGTSAMHPRVSAIAVATLATSTVRALPFAVCDEFDVISSVKCTPISIYVSNLTVGTNACGASPANAGPLSLGGSGASNYRDNIENGYSGVLTVGQCVDTEPGQMTGPTQQGMDDRLNGQTPYFCTPTSLPPVQDGDPGNDKRQAILPKVKNLLVNGRGQVCIEGFYTIALLDYNNATKTVTAQFVEIFSGTSVDPNAAPIPGQLNAVGLVK